MKALSLWQPWASWVAQGLKTIETRYWRTDLRGPIAICAAKRYDVEAIEAIYGQPSSRPGFIPGPFPLGVLVAVVDLVDCRPLLEEHLERAMCHKHLRDLDGRWGLWFENVRRTAETPVRGLQKFFTIDDDIIARALEHAGETSFAHVPNTVSGP